MLDVIVVGARCAGASLAMLLARKGYKVLLVDRATFPSDTISTHYIHQGGVERLHRWGLLEQLHASRCPPVYGYSLDLGPYALTGRPPPYKQIAAGYCPRRQVLDAILVEAAAAAGAEVRTGFQVQAILSAGDHVTGIRGHTFGEQLVNETATVTVGADGINSMVARTMRPPEYNTYPALTCCYYTYWGGVAAERVELYPAGNRQIGIWPTNEGLTVVFVTWQQAEFEANRGAIEQHYIETLRRVPKVAERVLAGERQERYAGSGRTRNFFRKPYGRGWALVGDAGYHRDPFTAHGITDAFRDAELLAEAIDAGLSGREPIETAMVGYERARNAAAGEMYEYTCQLARLEPPSAEMQQLFEALRGNQPETDRFFGTFCGTVHVSDFFAPENVARIMADAN